MQRSTPALPMRMLRCCSINRIVAQRKTPFCIDWTVIQLSRFIILTLCNRQGFCEVILSLSNFEEAVWSAVMHSGLGPVSPNTVLMSWMADWRRRVKKNGEAGNQLPPSDEDSAYSANENQHICSPNEFVNTLRGLGNMQRTVCMLKGNKFPRRGNIMPIGSTIDIYWVVDDGGLCLLLSYKVLIERSP